MTFPPHRDVYKRQVQTYEAIVKGKNVPTPGVPESFKVLVKELQSLFLDIQVLDEDGNQIELKEDKTPWIPSISPAWLSLIHI